MPTVSRVYAPERCRRAMLSAAASAERAILMMTRCYMSIMMASLICCASASALLMSYDSDDAAMGRVTSLMPPLLFILSSATPPFYARWLMPLLRHACYAVTLLRQRRYARSVINYDDKASDKTGAASVRRDKMLRRCATRKALESMMPEAHMSRWEGLLLTICATCLAGGIIKECRAP